MALISQQLPNLIGGISEQPSEFRRANQCADSLNTSNDVVSGVTKRSGSEYIRSLSLPSVTHFGAIERDEAERYIFHISPSGVRVWTDKGVEITVNAPGGYGYLAGASYYRHISIADNTFIVNPEVTVAMNAALTPATTSSGLLFIRAVDFNVKYTVDIDGVGAGAVSYTAPASGTIATETVATALAASLEAQPNITASARGPIVRYNVTGNYNITAATSRGDSYLTVVNGSIENFGDLPVVGYDGTIVKVTQNPTTDVDDYYVRFNGNGVGTWVETVAPGIQHQLNPATMPHVLVRESNGTFTFKAFTWANRLVGDVVSNNNPSFVGEKISNIFFERNRLGFLSDVNVILSESAGLNNFFRTTVSSIIDSDPIDLAVSGRQVDTPKTAIGVKDGILVFSENGQFLLNAGDADILSPETAGIVSVSSYKSNPRVEPIRVGDSILFVTRRDDRSGVREYFYSSGRDFTQSASITGHVPQLLPSTLQLMTGSSTENIVFFSSNSGIILYVYQFLFSGEEKIVSSWAKWRFGSAEIKFAHVFDDYLYVVLLRDTVLTLERVPLSSGFVQPNLPGEVHLDSYSTSVGVPRVFSSGSTTFTFSRLFTGISPILITASDRPSQDIFRGDVVVPTSITPGSTTTTVVLQGDWTTSEFYIGGAFVFLYELSTLFPRKDEGDVEIGGRLQVRNVDILLFNTGNCQFRVIYDTGGISSDVRDIEGVSDWVQISDMSSLSTFSIDEVGGEVYPLSRAYPEASLATRLRLINDTYRVPVMSQNTQYRLRVESDGWQSVTLSKAQWEALYHKRSRG